MDKIRKYELGDDELDMVVGGYEAGQRVRASVGVSNIARSAASCC